MEPPAEANLSLREQWDVLSRLPDGRRRFSQLVGRMAPYSATIQPEILELARGYCKVQMQDRDEIRNHLDSIHAIALMNLAEITSGLAMLYGAPDDARSIITGLSIEYHKKARGMMTAECRCEVPESSESREYTLVVDVHDSDGDRVATARARWLLGPR